MITILAVSLAISGIFNVLLALVIWVARKQAVAISNFCVESSDQTLDLLYSQVKVFDEIGRPDLGTKLELQITVLLEKAKKDLDSAKYL